MVARVRHLSSLSQIKNTIVCDDNCPTSCDTYRDFCLYVVEFVACCVGVGIYFGERGMKE